MIVFQILTLIILDGCIFCISEKHFERAIKEDLTSLREQVREYLTKAK